MVLSKIHGKFLYYAIFVCSLVAIVFCFSLVQQYKKNFYSPYPKGYNPLTIHTNNGRLGNQMFTLAVLYGLCHLNHRQMKVMPQNKQALIPYFDINYPEINPEMFVESHPWPIKNWLRPEDASIPERTNIIKGEIYPTSYTFFDKYRDDIKKLFRFKQPIQEYAENTVKKFKVENKNATVVGVHVRRGDYITTGQGSWLAAFDGRKVDIEYFVKATNYYKSKYPHVVFLIVSDDRKWCKDNLEKLGMTIASPAPSAAHDLATLVNSDHVIMTYGTFGFWGGYLGGGEVVYFTDFLKPNTSFVKNYFIYEKMYPPEWIGISTTKPGFWESFTGYSKD